MMEQYLLHCTFPSLEYWHKDLVAKVADKFCVSTTKDRGFNPHFTLKRRFNVEDPKQIETILDEFSRTHKATPLQIKGVNSFSHGTVYLEVNLSEQANYVRSELMDALHEFPTIESKKKSEGETESILITPHLTIAEGCKKEVVAIVKKHLEEQNICVDLMFDNITVLRRCTEGDCCSLSRYCDYNILKVYKLAKP